MRDGKDIICDDLVAIHRCCLVKLQLTCLLIWYVSIIYASRISENQREKPFHQTCQLTLWNPIRHVCCYLADVTYMLAGPVLLRVESCLICRCSCTKYACWPSATDTSTAAVQTCLLVECCCKMGACWTVATQSECLSIFCHSILHAHRCVAFLSAIHVAVHTCTCWCRVSL